MFKIKNYTNAIKYIHDEEYISTRDEQRLEKNNFKNRNLTDLKKIGGRDYHSYCKQFNYTVKAKQFISSFVKNKYMEDDLKICTREIYRKGKKTCFYKHVVIEVIKTNQFNKAVLDAERITTPEKVFNSFIEEPKNNNNIHSSPFNYQIIETFFEAIKSLDSSNVWKKEQLYKEKVRIKKEGNLAQRRSRRFLPFYKNCFFKPVFNKEGDAIEGTCVNDSSLYVNIELKKFDFPEHDKNKLGDEVYCQYKWQAIFEYGNRRENRYEHIINLDWKNNVAKENIAVADRKIILKAKIIDINPIESIPCTTFKVTWLQRARNGNVYSLVEKDGYVIRLGDKENPIAIRATEHLSQVRSIAQNTATRIFFQKLTE